MITPEQALARMLAMITPLGTQSVALAQAAGRVLREPVTAQRDQPPFRSSAMDGYAINGTATPGARFRVIGRSEAGHGFAADVAPGQAVRIFTGAPVPDACSRVIIQEDVTRQDDMIVLGAGLDASAYIRPVAGDFAKGDQIAAPRLLRPVDLALIAAMNCPEVTVSRKPDLAIIATGDELVMPGMTPRADQIMASNGFALKAMAEACGAQARLLPIAADRESALREAFALAHGADVIVTIGGASVGDHDLVAAVTRDLGVTPAFDRVALRPGKPMMAGIRDRTLVLAVPGNPVSALVCGHLFLRPALWALQGLGQWPLPTSGATLGCDLPANGKRAHYMRARLGPGPTITPFANQDSSLLSLLADADALLIRPALDPARQAGCEMRYIRLQGA